MDAQDFIALFDLSQVPPVTDVIATRDDTSTISTFSCEDDEESFQESRSQLPLTIALPAQSSRKRLREQELDGFDATCENLSMSSANWNLDRDLETLRKHDSSVGWQATMIHCVSDSESNVKGSEESLLPVSLPEAATRPCCLPRKLPDDVLCQVARCLDLRSLKQARLVSRRWSRILATDNAGWDNHYELLRSRKVHVAPPAPNAPHKLIAYQLACQDARSRQELLDSELLYDVAAKSGTIWHFRFKQAAGAEWTEADPWHYGEPCRKIVFLRDGTVMQIDPVTNDLRHPFYEGRDTGLSVSWRYVQQPLDLPAKPNGAYIRLSVGGRDVPTYIVHRSPTGNWGFLLENCWGVFAGFPLNSKQGSGQDALTRRWRIRRTSRGSTRWTSVRTDDEDEDEDDEHELQQVAACVAAAPHSLLARKRLRRCNDLLSDASLVVTDRWQWREALLYNMGANMLPDGPEAAYNFHKVYADAFPYDAIGGSGQAQSMW